MIPDSLLRFRPEFPILEKTTFLIFSLGAMPRRATIRLREYGETWVVARRAGLGRGVVGRGARAGIRSDQRRRSPTWERWRGRPALVT